MITPTASAVRSERSPRSTPASSAVPMAASSVSRLSLFRVEPMWVSIGMAKVATAAVTAATSPSRNLRAAHQASSGSGAIRAALTSRSRASSRSADMGPPPSHRSTRRTLAMAW